MAKKPAAFTIPKTLGACADAIYTLRQERLARQREVDVLEKNEALLREHIIKTLPKSEAGGVAGKVGRVTIVKKEVPQVNDWEAFYAFLFKTKDPSLLQKRVAEAAIRERWEARKTVPGVVPFTVITLGVTKV